MKLISLLLFFFISLDVFACSRAELRINRFFENRNQAFNNARRDAGIPRTQQPSKVDSVPLTDRAGNPILDANNQRIMTREYHYTNTRGQRIVIQEHTAGHMGTRQAGGMPHFNVRPIENTRTGSVPGTAAHYNIGTE